MRLYAATFDCPHCGKPHQAAGRPGLGLLLDHGPDQAGTAAELWPRGDYPPAVTGLLISSKVSGATHGQRAVHLS